MPGTDKNVRATMRIIAGEFRSREILAPKGGTTRPITDRVKQSLFDILNPYIEGSRVYDCFAGTGSMGLECLSRGAAHVTFFEADRSAVGLLQKNIAALHVGDRSTVIDRDLFKWFDAAAAKGTDKVDLVFLDPPYRFLRERPEDLRRVATRLSGIVIFRHDTKDQLEFPDWTCFDCREYGGMTIELLKRP